MIDKFFYSGYGGVNTLDPGGLVGGYAGDGWFKMFEFLEVPSQMIGAIGPVANGTNFDWLRQDVKPGQLNLNLIIDEEVFFSLVGRQTITQSNGQFLTTPGTVAGTAVYPSDQFTQTNLNFDQIMPGSIPGTSGLFGTLELPGANYVPGGNNPNVAGNLAPYALPAPLGTPPIPMVVTSTLSTGAPASAYPLWNSGATYGGVLAADPIYNNGILLSSTTVANGNPPQYTNALKEAWIQFLWLRHGGSGYMFGYGTGAVGQNVSIAPNGTIPGANGLASQTSTLPAEIPFHSLSFPDIDHTVMRPAALPPGVSGVQGGTPAFYTAPNANPVPGTLAAALYGTVPPAVGVTTPWQNPATYGNATTPLWNTFVGDPGVRNYLLYAGYPSAYVEVLPTLLPTGWTMTPVTTFLGYPGFPSPAPPSPSNPNPPNAVAPGVDTYWPVYPPPIPVRRLFQIPDSYNPNPNSLPLPLTVGPPPTSPLSASNAGETGDPSLNLLVPVNPIATVGVPVPAAGALPPINYTFGTPATTTYGVLSNSVVNLYWPGGTTTPTTAVKRVVHRGRRPPRSTPCRHLGRAAATTSALPPPPGRLREPTPGSIRTGGPSTCNAS